MLLCGHSNGSLQKVVRGRSSRGCLELPNSTRSSISCTSCTAVPASRDHTTLQRSLMIDRRRTNMFALGDVCIGSLCTLAHLVLGQYALAHDALAFYALINHAAAHHALTACALAHLALADSALAHRACLTMHHLTAHYAMHGTATHLEYDLRMAVGGIIVAVHIEGPQNLDPRGVHGHQNHALLLVGGCRGVCLAHEDGDLAAWVRRPTGPPLVAIHNVLVALPAARAYNQLCIQP